MKIENFYFFPLRVIVAICLFMVVCTSGAISQTTIVRASTDKNKILLGEPFWLTLETKAVKDNGIKGFDIGSIPHFEFITHDSLTRQVNGDTIILKQYYQLTSFDSGQWVIPPIVLRPFVKTNSVLIDVGYTSGFNPQQPYKEVKPIKDIPFRLDARIEKWWYWIALSLILLVILVYLITGNKKNSSTPKFKAAESAFQTAMKSLAELNSSKVEERIYFSGLVEIYRRYILERAGISSMQQTTNDMIEKMKHLFQDETAYRNMCQVLQLCHFVKFAKYHPDKTETRSALDITTQSIKYIEEGMKSGKIVE